MGNPKTAETASTTWRNPEPVAVAGAAKPHVQVHRLSGNCGADARRIERFVNELQHPSRDLGWLNIFRQALGHRTFVLEARSDGRTIGILLLAEVSSWWFGSFLVSLPYLNHGGVWTSDPHAASALIDEAVRLADELNVRYLEMRHELEHHHPRLRHQLTSKVHMRLTLPASTEELWSQFKSKLRSQIRNAERRDFSVTWGGIELLKDFYDVFSHNMRDLGTPVYGKPLFRAILNEFPNKAELCCVQAQGKAVAAALLLHGANITEVPSASALRSFRSSNANMLMYWCLLQRAIARGSSIFDFGRSSIESSTYQFKKQWGAMPSPAVWQYYVRHGNCDALRPDNAKFSLAIRVWCRLPVAVTRCLGPRIVRGIP